MKVDIADIKATPGAKMTFACDGSLHLDEVRFQGPVQLRLKLANAGTRILVTGEVAGAVSLECARCAEAFDLPLTVEIDEEFLPSTSPEVAEAGGFVWSDINVFDVDEDEIELNEILRQNVIAALPIQPLCTEACAGLCANCGENLNRATCSCAKTDLDPRLAGLLDLQAKYRSPNGD